MSGPEFEGVCANGTCGERAYCAEAGTCLALAALTTTDQEDHR